MHSFREAKEQAEHKRLLELMSRIERDPAISQRALASELGIALGLMNAYLKRCVKKGWIKVGHASASRTGILTYPSRIRGKE
jgi:DNA-binding MarR family transcriptional regulator